MKNWLFTTEPKQLEYYNGLLIHADTGLHEQAIRIFQQYVKPESSVLDVGAGAGAFSRRLKDNQYKVTSLDIDPEKWLLPDISFSRLDINKGIAGSVSETYDAICCLEVIEHIENPWQLMRDLREIIKPGGYLLLSTPNITSFLSRILFVRKGNFHQFEEDDLSYGHINPLTEHEITNIAKNTGWNPVEIKPGGYLPVFDFTNLTLKKLLYNLARGLFYIISSGHKNGWVLFFVFQRLS